MSDRKSWQPTLSKESAFEPDHPAWNLWYALLKAHGSDEAAALLAGYQRWYAHDLAEKQRAEWATIRSLITQIHPDDIAGLIDLIDPGATE